MGVRIATRTGILSLVGAALVVAPAAAPAAAATAKRAPGCSARGAEVVARSGTSLLLATPTGPGGDQYGPGTRVSTCRQGHPRVTLVRTGTGSPLTIDHAVFTPGYVAFASTSVSVPCTKYFGDDPQCRSALVSSYNRRTGRRRAAATGAVDVLVATPAGWLAWLSPPDPTGTRTLQAVDAAGVRVLATGLVDPGSVRADGATISWATAGVAGSAVLG